ncbi:uncharacterized protein LOC142559935 [Dermacentor variabilis]|uniref:uncharacterized protein LOC142559935 n=1 Tax=Dermacentor variabilis TaxID=34621 RepID=UPI003F5B9D4A
MGISSCLGPTSSASVSVSCHVSQRVGMLKLPSKMPCPKKLLTLTKFEEHKRNHNGMDRFPRASRRGLHSFVMNHHAGHARTEFGVGSTPEAEAFYSKEQC